MNKELIGILLDVMAELEGKQLMPFNPIGSLEDVLEVCDYDSVDSLTRIWDSLTDSKLLEAPPEDISKFTFYCLVVQLNEDEQAYFFRRITNFKKLKKGIIGQLVSGDYQKIEAELLGIDNYVDIIGYDGKLIAINHVSMERIFDIKTQYRESAMRTLALIKDTGRIENFARFEEDSINDGRVIRGLTRILQDPSKVDRCFENFEKIKELVHTMQLNIRFSEDGSQLVYEDKNQLQNITLIIRDAYYQTFITERYGVDELA
jgi:hypothetical protein